MERIQSVVDARYLLSPFGGLLDILFGTADARYLLSAVPSMLLSTAVPSTLLSTAVPRAQERVIVNVQ